MRRRSGPPKQKVLYLPTFLASVSLPHSKVEGSEFSRVNGDIRLSLLAPEDPGLPYGVYPRLALMHLTTKALLQKERTFYVGESANEFLARMGIADNGGPRGMSTRARDQLRRLCLTSFAYHDVSRVVFHFVSTKFFRLFRCKAEEFCGLIHYCRKELQWRA